MSIRQAAVAGSFYPKSQQALTKLLAELMPDRPAAVLTPKALLVPHAGYIYSGQTAGLGFTSLRHATFQRVILLGPSHHFGFDQVALPKADHWETPLGKVPIDREAVAALAQQVDFIVSDQIHATEHALEVELPFLQRVLSSFALVPLCLGQNLDHQSIAASLLSILDEHSIIIVSSDLSHYLPQAEANHLDQQTLTAFRNLDSAFVYDGNAACGLEGVLVLLELARQLNWKADLLDYRTSFDISQDDQQVVGYAAMAFYQRRPGK